MEIPISPEQPKPITEAPKTPLAETQQVTAPHPPTSIAETATAPVAAEPIPGATLEPEAVIGNRSWKIKPIEQRPGNPIDPYLRGLEVSSPDRSTVLNIILRPGNGEYPTAWFLDIANSVVGGKIRGGRAYGQIPPIREAQLTQTEIRDVLRYISKVFPDIERVEGPREALGHRRTFQSVSLARFRRGRQVPPSPAAKAAETAPAPAETSLLARIKSLFQKRKKD